MRDLKSMEVLTQKGPACGTTSLAMVIRFLTGDKKLTPDDIDRKIRKQPGMFSAPSDLIDYARETGLQAEQYNNGSLQELDGLVSRGIPAMTLLDLTPENALDFSQWHWVVVVAIDGADERKILTINNPWGQQEQWGESKFSEEWSCLRLLGLTFGYNNYFLAIGTTDDSLPPHHTTGTSAANTITKGLADVLNGFAIIKGDRNPGGLGKILSGIIRLLYGFPVLLVFSLLHRAKSVTP